jgi:hypothetical protein
MLVPGIAGYDTTHDTSFRPGQVGSSSFCDSEFDAVGAPPSRGGYPQKYPLAPGHTFARFFQCLI